MSASPVRRSRRVTAGRSPARFDPSKPANLWADADPGTAPGKEGSSARAQATVGVASPAAAADGHTGRWTVLGVWWVAHALVGGVGRVAFDIALPYILADPAVDLPEMIKIGTVSTIAGGDPAKISKNFTVLASLERAHDAAHGRVAWDCEQGIGRREFPEVATGFCVPLAANKAALKPVHAGITGVWVGVSPGRSLTRVRLTGEEGRRGGGFLLLEFQRWHAM